MPTVITSALPYANGSIHLGHLVEYIQTDIFSRFMKITGEDAIYVCADDTHGAPIELKARELGIQPEKLIQDVHEEHARDFAAFDVDFDIFYSTNSPENHELAEFVYGKLKESNTIIRKTIPGTFCEHDKRFLPDRYVRGTCPKCGAVDQYGDSCEVCSATYNPADLKDPRCSLCGKLPVIKESEHLFFELSKCADFLSQWVNRSDALQQDVANFVGTWLKEGLKDWCISRDGPYFGFPIPGETDKYFYVWLDAPIGYVSSTKRYCQDKGRNFRDYWQSKDGTIYHFIGKDIVYFHTLFWPAMLHLSDLNLPNKVFVHGFLTVNGEKMSKSRGTFITAAQYLNTIGREDGPSYLRYYYASKLTGRSEDVDLNIEDFRLKVNAGLVNNVCNFHNRSFTFCMRQFKGNLGKLPAQHVLIQQAQQTVVNVEQHYRNLEYNRAIEKISLLGDAGNKFFQDSAPWDKIKTDRDAALADITLCVNLVKVLAVLLKPVVPSVAAGIEKQLGKDGLQWTDAKMDLENMSIAGVEKLVLPIEKQKAEAIIRPPEEEKKMCPDQDGLVSIDEFGKIELRIASVLEAEKIPKADRLLKLKVDLGDEQRTLVAGVAEHYTPEDMKGSQIVVVANLQPAKIKGIESRGMLLAAKDGNRYVLVRPDKECKPGSKVA